VRYVLIGFIFSVLVLLELNKTAKDLSLTVIDVNDIKFPSKLNSVGRSFSIYMILTSK
jgi:hypothetical protein